MLLFDRSRRPEKGESVAQLRRGIRACDGPALLRRRRSNDRHPDRRRTAKGGVVYRSGRKASAEAQPRWRPPCLARGAGKACLICRRRQQDHARAGKAPGGRRFSLSVDDAIDAALEGNIARFDLAFGRLSASSNQAANQILGSALRQFQSLQLMRAAMDADGRSASASVASARPPIFFTRRKLIENALVRWNADTIARALAALQSAVLQIRKRSDLAEPIGRQACSAIAVEAARRERR